MVEKTTAKCRVWLKWNMNFVKEQQQKIWRWGTIYFISSCICNASFFAIRFSIISTYRNGIVRTCLLAVCFHFSPFLFHIFNEVIAVQMTCDKWNVCTLSPFSLFLLFGGLCLCLLISLKNIYDCTRQTAFIINCKRSSVDLSKYMQCMEKSSSY